MNDFQILKEFVEEINTTNSTNEKLEIFKNPKYYYNLFIRGIHEYTYSDFKQYYLTSNNLKKNKDLISENPVYFNIFTLLDDLNARRITGHTAIKEVNSFIQNYEEYRELIYNIIDRNLKTRITTKLVNKIIPNLIPTFDVALANTYDDKISERIDFKCDNWYGSRKLDGVRCLLIFDTDGDIKAISRKGKEFHTLDVLIEEAKKLELINCVIDGEVCIVDKNGKEFFQGLSRTIMRKDYSIDNPRLYAFDLIDLYAFKHKQGKIIFSERQDKLKGLLKDFNSDIIKHLKQEKIIDKEHLKKLTTFAFENNWEGIMIRKDIPHEGKRSNNLLKCKKFFDREYIVKDIEIGPFRVIVNGKEIKENVLSNVLIEHKGCPVNVGSGISLEDRRYYATHSDELIGNEITVQYFEETIDKNGKFSLRFPVVKEIYKGKRQI